MQTETPPLVKAVTPRQKDVIERLVLGDDLNETARSLKLSRKTVEKHVEMAKARLGAKTLAHLVVTAAQAGLVTL